jgi:hypothetical protein
MGSTALALRAVFSACRLRMVQRPATLYGPPSRLHLDCSPHVGREVSTLVGRSADLGAIDAGWRQGDTIYGIHGLEAQRRGMASQRNMSHLETESEWRSREDNAGRQARLQAGAQRTLEAVGCTVFGDDFARDNRIIALPRILLGAVAARCCLSTLCGEAEQRAGKGESCYFISWHRVD